MERINEILLEPRFVVKKFYADWCSPCINVVGPLLKGLSSEYDDVLFEGYNVDEDFDLADSYNVTSVPTVIILNNLGDEVHRFVGPFTKTQFKKIVS